MASSTSLQIQPNLQQLGYSTQVRSMTSPDHLIPTLPKIPIKEFYFSRREIIPPLCQAYWLIQEGFVRSNTWDSNGTMMTVGIWGAGDIIGSSLSNLDPYQLECLSMVKVDRVISPPNLTEILLRQYRYTEELLSIIHHQPVSDRLLRLLHWLAQRFGVVTPEGDQQIDLRFTHQQLADIAGTTRVTVTRVLKRLEKDQMLRSISKKRYVLKATAPIETAYRSM